MDKFGEDVTGADLELSRAGNNLKITIRNTADSLTIRNWFTSSGEKFPIDHVIFTDGTIVTGYELTQVIYFPMTGTPQNETMKGTDFADLIDGQGGDDTIWGYKGDDTIKGGPGNDRLIGGAGSDRYVFNPGTAATSSRKMMTSIRRT